jgi:kynureninase
VLTIDEARGQWSPEGVYLNTASYGLPPRDGFDALQEALAGWRAGRTSWELWGESTVGARAAFAAMVGVAPERVAIGSTVSEFVGLAAACLPVGARVIVPDVEFTSTLFPFLVQEARGRGDRRAHRRRRVQRRADEHRRGRRPRCDRRRSGAPWCADAAGCDAGVRLAAR